MNKDNNWGTDAETFLHQSYNHWQWSQYHSSFTFSTVDQLRENSTSNSTSGAALPVCFPPQPIQSYNKLYNQDTALPCICGDELGNETMAFFKETNFRSWVAGERGKGLAEACQTSFEIDKTWPVQAYIAYCYLRWHFPVHDDQHSDNYEVSHGKHRFHWGFDVMCKQVQEEAIEILTTGGSNIDVNCHLCWQSDVGTAIKNNQRDYVHHSRFDRHNKYNFKEACEKQVGKKKVCNLER